MRHLFTTRIRVILIIAVLLAAALLLRPEQKPDVVRGDFVPPEFDAAAVTGVPQVERPDIYGTLYLNQETAVSLYSMPILRGEQVQVFFTSPADNTAWVRLRLLDQAGNVLGQTGLLKPGEYVEYVALDVMPQDATVIAKFLTYQPETYYSLGSASAEIELQRD